MIATARPPQLSKWTGTLPATCFLPGKHNVPPDEWGSHTVPRGAIKTCLLAHFPGCLEMRYAPDTTGKLRPRGYVLRPDLMSELERVNDPQQFKRITQCMTAQIRTAGQLRDTLLALYRIVRIFGRFSRYYTEPKH